MNTKVVFFMKPKSFKGWLMKTFTGCYSYHCGFLMEDTQWFYDMFWMRRRIPWDQVVTGHADSVLKVFDSPVEIEEKYFVDQILNHNTHYGIFDYAKFAFRWIYHLFGKATPNEDGLICSEMVSNDLRVHRWSVTYKEVPSPCDLIKGLTDIHCRSKLVFGRNIPPADQQAMVTLANKEIV